MKTYRVWNNYDANNYFEVEADSPHDAAIVALGELGWSVSAKPIEEERNDD